jgi:glucose-6-phosphate isomerase
VKGFTGKALTSVLTIGIGGSYLGIEFIHEALRSSPKGIAATQGRKIKFIANVDPTDFHRAVEGLVAEETLIIVNSKTFTTAETMLNAKTVKNWLLGEYKKHGHKVDSDEEVNKICNAHMAAVSTNLDETRKFGISDDKVFGFWDWVGGRFSVWSAIGVLPLSVHYGFDIMKEFLDGGHEMDEHFVNT